MNMQAVVFRKAHEPLTIGSVEFDKPRGREVLVRQALEGACSSRMKSYSDFLPQSGCIRPVLSASQDEVDITARPVEAQCGATTLRTLNADGGPAGPDTLWPK